MNNVDRYKHNICWDCQKAVCGCNWSRNFTPVEGWEAELIEYQPWDTNDSHPHTTYHITKCPEFVKDEPRVTSGLILTNEENAEFLKGKRIKVYAGYHKQE